MFEVLVDPTGLSSFRSITAKLWFTFSVILWTSPDLNIMHLLRSLLKAAAWFAAIHVPGRNNGIDDALSCFNLQAFYSQAPHAKNKVSSPHHPSSALSLASIVIQKLTALLFMYQGLAASTRRTYSCVQQFSGCLALQATATNFH